MNSAVASDSWCGGLRVYLFGRWWCLLVFNPQEPKKKKGKKSTGKKGGGGGGAARGGRARGKKAAGKVTVLSKVQSCVLFIELLRVNSVKGAWRLSVAAKIVPFARPPWSCSRLVIFPPVSAFALGLVKTSVFGGDDESACS